MAKVAHAGAAAVAGGAVAAGASTVNKKRSTAAGVELWNSIAAADDPTEMDPAVADSIKQRFAGSKDALSGIKQAYGGYLQVPPSPLFSPPPLPRGYPLGTALGNPDWLGWGGLRSWKGPLCRPLSPARLPTWRCPEGRGNKPLWVGVAADVASRSDLRAGCAAQHRCTESGTMRRITCMGAPLATAATAAASGRLRRCLM